jgi:ABC-type multidrug transport system ATPase subunit
LVWLLGPSGAGKSTVVSMLTGETRPTQGHALLHGQPSAGCHGVAHPVGLCLQDDTILDASPLSGVLVGKGGGRT